MHKNTISAAKSAVKDYKKSIKLERIALAKLFYCDYLTNQNDVGLILSDISKIMFEYQDSHVRNYFYYIDKRKGELQREFFESFINQSKNDRFYIDESSSCYSFLQLHPLSGRDLIDEFYTGISSVEKESVASDEGLHKAIRQLKDDTDFGLSVITQNYVQFLDRVSGKEREKFVEGLRKRKPHLSASLKLISKAAPNKTYELLRLGLDAWGYSMFDILMGQFLANKLGLNYRLEQSIAKQMADMIIGAQHDTIGSWAIGDYDVGFQIIDTGLVVQLLHLISMNFPSISIPEDTLERARDFVRKQLYTFTGKTGKIAYCKVDNPAWRQNTLLATLYAFITLYRIHLMKHEKNFLQDETNMQLLRYVMELKEEKGAFRKIPKEEIADLESTTLVTKGLLGKYNFDFGLNDIERATKIRYDPIRTLGYFQDNWNTALEYMVQGNLNVMADTLHSILVCGAWPLSTHVTDKLLEVSKRGRENLSAAKDYNFWAWFADPASQWKTHATYSNVIKGVHVLHEVLFCMDIVDDYIREPDNYWKRLSPILKVHKSS